MESTEPTAPKLRRILPAANLHLSECVRQFKLPQQFPSTVAGHKPVAIEHTLNSANSYETQSQVKSLHTKTIVLKNNCKYIRPTENTFKQLSSHLALKHPPISSTSIKTQKIVTKSISENVIRTFQKINPVSTSSLGTDSSPQLKTLKLKSPDGKDLGEFQVKVVQELTNPLKRKVSIVKNNSSCLDESLENEVVSSTQTEPVVSYSIKDVQYPGVIYQEPRIEPVRKDLNSKVKIISNVSLNRGSLKSGGIINKGAPGTKKMLTASLESLTNAQINHPWIKMDTSRVIFQNRKNVGFVKSDTQLNTDKLQYLRTEEHPYFKNITQSGKSISLKPFNIKTLNSKSNGVQKVESSEINFVGTSGLSGLKNGDMDEELKDNEEQAVDSKSPHGSKLVMNSLNLRKNVMVKVPGVPFRRISKQVSSESSSDLGSLDNSDEEEDLRFMDSDNSNGQDFLMGDRTTGLSELKRQRNLDSKRKTELNLENSTKLDISIVERALASVKDKHLREEALKVLATCKLGADRHVPIRPPVDQLSIRDTSSQTNIFGNLDRDCEEFIEVDEKETSLKRIKKNMRDSSMVYNSFNSAPILGDTNEDNNFTTELDKMLTEMNVSTQEQEVVKNIKNVLERPIQCTERVIQIQKQMAEDCRKLTNFDDSGFTGLHRAVVNDEVNTVKRLLMIRKLTKIDVDMKTEEGKTSLELALKTDSDPEIVHALLREGAATTTDEVGRDSALMIASKNSSPLLPELVKYADKKHFDCMDSEGFAAIHNCASRGNLTAIKALVAAGANINLQDCRSGRTALFHAIENQHTEVARQLLALGAKSNIRTNDGHTILSLLDDPKYQTLKNAVNKLTK